MFSLGAYICFSCSTRRVKLLISVFLEKMNYYILLEIIISVMFSLITSLYPLSPVGWLQVLDGWVKLDKERVVWSGVQAKNIHYR